MLCCILASPAALAADRQDLKTCASTQDPDAAIASCTRVIEDKTQDAHTRGGGLFFRAFGREKKKDIDGAIADLSEAIKIDPNPGSAYSARGRIYHETGDDEKAFADMNAAIRSRPNVALFYLERGEFYLEKSRNDFAIDDFTTAIQLKPDYADAYWQRGEANADATRRGRAIADYTEVIRLEPERPARLWRPRRAVPGPERPRSRHRRLTARWSGSIRRPSACSPHAATSIATRASIDRAIADYTEALRIMPDNAIVLHDRGVAYR